MNDMIPFLFLCGGAGWLLLICSCAFGGKKQSVFSALQAFVFWAMGLDFLGTWFYPGEAIIKKVGLGWRFVTFYVVLPYALWAWRLRWRWKRRRADAARNSQPATRNAP